MKRVFEITGLLAVLSIATAASGQAADPGADDERLARRNAIGKGTIHHNAHPDGILPLIDYSGDLWSRSTLTGDWGGARESLAAKGISTDLSFATVLQGVAHALGVHRIHGQQVGVSSVGGQGARHGERVAQLAPVGADEEDAEVGHGAPTRALPRGPCRTSGSSS